MNERRSSAAVEPIDWDEALALRASTDERTGLRVVKLAGAEGTHTYLARIAVAAEVPSHYHELGDEQYHVLQGCGELALHDLDSGARQTVAIAQRQSFVIAPRVVHALRNVGRTPLLLMFCCDAAHLDTDRRFVDGS